MKKRYPTLLLLLAAVIPLSAQVLLRYGADIDAGFGSANAVITPYVNFPAAFSQPYEGNQVVAVRIGLKQPATNVYIYIKHEAHDAQYIYRQKVSQLDAGWNEVILDTPYSIPSDGFAVGYKGSFAAANGVGYSHEKFADGDIVYYNSDNKWTSTGGSVCIQALVEGDHMPVDELKMGRLPNLTAPYDAQEMTFTGTVRNVGANEVTNYLLRYSVDEGEAHDLYVDHLLAVNATDTFQVTVPSTDPGQHNLRVWVEQVNGHADSYADNNEALATLTVKDPTFMRKVVCEEYTGLWCGWCPRGMVGLDLMLEQHPTQFIPISIHGSGGDPMEIDASLSYTYRPFIDMMEGAPSCVVDRKIGGDPYANIQALFNTESNTDAPLSVTAKAVWSADSTTIAMQTDFFPSSDLTDVNYNIAYVLTEDSITGYSQANYYSGGSEFYGWEDKGNPTTDCWFNYVARGIFSNYQGESCLTGSVSAYQVTSHSYSFEVPPTVRDKRQLYVTALLIDANTGYILNADRTRPLGSDTGIRPSTDLLRDQSTRAYNLLGQPVSPASKGLRILVEGGKVRKVFTK